MKNIKIIAQIAIISLIASLMSPYIPIVDAADGQDITINDGGMTVWDTDQEYDDIVISGGSLVGLTGGYEETRTLTFDTLTITGNSMLVCNRCILQADDGSAGTITVDVGSSINADGGLAGGEAGGPAGANNGDGDGGGTGTANGGGGGGGYGGAGGRGEKNGTVTTPGGSAYGDPESYSTNLYGSGGGGGTTGAGGDGAGVVIIRNMSGTTDGTINLNGRISANGEDGEDGDGAGGGGAGGKLVIFTKEIVGGGTIEALGGDGGTDTNDGDDNGGGGGGGRIILFFAIDSHTSYDLLSLPTSAAQLGALGGGNAENGSNGTVFSETYPYLNTPTFTSQATDGSGYVTFQVTVNEAGSDPTNLTVAYSADGGTSYHVPDLVSVTPSSGTVDLVEDTEEQIGSVDAIDTNTGPITLTIVWDTKSVSNTGGAISTEEDDIKIRLFARDNYPVSSDNAFTENFSVDNLGPQGLATAILSKVGATLSASFTAASTESNFSHYELWFGETESDVENETGTATEWDDSDDALLATLSTASTTTTSPSINGHTYFGKVVAVDDFGNTTETAVAEYYQSGGGGSGGGGSSGSTGGTGSTGDTGDSGTGSESESGEESNSEEEQTEDSEDTSIGSETSDEESTVTEEESSELEEVITEETTPVAEEETSLNEEELTIQNEDLYTELKSLVSNMSESYAWARESYESLLEVPSFVRSLEISPNVRGTFKRWINDPSAKVQIKEALTVTTPVLNEEVVQSERTLTVNALKENSFARNVFSDITHPDFNENNEIDRAEAMRIIFKSSNLKLKLSFSSNLLETFGFEKAPFKDLVLNNISASYVLYFTKEGIISGYNDQTIRATNEIERAEFIKMLDLFNEKLIK